MSISAPTVDVAVGAVAARALAIAKPMPAVAPVTSEFVIKLRFTGGPILP